MPWTKGQPHSPETRAKMSAARKGNSYALRHGHSQSATYESWQAMKARCLNPHNIKFPIYGLRGITFCERWQNFENFLKDMGERPAGTSLDRIDNNGNYEPSNCRWATASQQSLNRRQPLRDSKGRIAPTIIFPTEVKA